MKYLKIALQLIVLIFLILLFSPYVVPGIILGIFLRGKWPRTVTLIAGLCLVFGYRMLGLSNLKLDVLPDNSWFTTFMEFFISWAICCFFFHLGYQVRDGFLKGFRSIQPA